MNSGARLFLPHKETHAYPALKELFLKLLAETERRCLKLYRNKYDEERYAMITVHPDIEERKSKIDNCKKIIMEEMKITDSEAKYFYNYVFGLSELKFNVLFMKIFVGKLNKYWIPAANENKIYNTQPTLLKTCTTRRSNFST